MKQRCKGTKKYLHDQTICAFFRIFAAVMEQEINRALDTLLAGGTILYPTDTIWGLGCDARRADAVDRLYAIKQRDRSKSMLVLVDPRHTPGFQDALKVMNTSTLPDDRPTTYILPRAVWHPLLGDSIAPNLPADDGSLGVRWPQHVFCQELMRRLGAPLVSTSANFSGYPSPQTYNEIEEELKRRVDCCVAPLPEFLSTETRGSRIVKVNPDGSQTVIRP